jgi:large subunit ribosomal protein L17
MKHGSFPRKLGRDPKHRWAMLRTMVTQLIEHERISTTVAKAKELRKLADQVVTMAKKGTLAARRQAGAIVRTVRIRSHDHRALKPKPYTLSHEPKILKP